MIALDGTSLTLEDIVDVARRFEPVTVDEAAAARVRTSRAVVDAAAARDQPAYGVNTGFGSLAEVAIPHDAVGALQLNLLRSHAAGVGAPLPIDAVRATMLLRANVLAKGFSGIRLETLLALVRALNARVHPVVPSRGSVGASGDLAPLAHLALVLVGEGHATVGEAAGEPMPGAEALDRVGLRPLELGPKEGLALINGTQPSTALLALALADALRVTRHADVAAAMSLDALRGSAHPFEARIHAARPFAGQMTSAANLAALLAGSAINRSHEACGRIQDAYSLRCAAQVHGAARDGLRFVARTVAIEANAATDNPMVFADTGEIVSGGNFHGAPVSMAADLLVIAVAPLATISERRTERLLNAASSGLPPFLVRESGVQSGLMLAQVTAAALASEIKTLAHPASVDSIPTSANKEDHVSMSMTAALKASAAVAVARDVIAIELLCAAQALDLLAPLTTSAPLARVHARIRRDVPTLTTDRPPAPDIAAVARLIDADELAAACDDLVK